MNINEVSSVIGIADRLMTSFNESRGKFLDARASEWAKRVKNNYREHSTTKGLSNERARERMALLREIEQEIAKNCRRDIIIPQAIAERGLQKQLNQLDSMRREDNITPEGHPTILALRAELSFLCNDFKSGEDWIDKAISANENTAFAKTQAREEIRLNCLKSRALYKNNKFKDAINLVDQCVSAAKCYSEEEEKEAFKFMCSKGGKTTLPVKFIAWFSACDTRVNSPQWNDASGDSTNSDLQQQFSYLWQESVEHEAPKIWTPPLQIAAISDQNWNRRVSEYILEISRNLYINLAANPLEKFLRCAHFFWARIPASTTISETVSKRSIAVIILVLGIFFLPINQNNNPIVGLQESSTVQQVAEIVQPTIVDDDATGTPQQQDNTFTLGNFNDYMTSALEEVFNEKFAHVMNNALKELSQNNNGPALTSLSSGDGSAELV